LPQQLLQTPKLCIETGGAARYEPGVLALLVELQLSLVEIYA
jgi:hypothetical protein